MHSFVVQVLLIWRFKISHIKIKKNWCYRKFSDHSRPMCEHNILEIHLLYLIVTAPLWRAVIDCNIEFLFWWSKNRQISNSQPQRDTVVGNIFNLWPLLLELKGIHGKNISGACQSLINNSKFVYRNTNMN